MNRREYIFPVAAAFLAAACGTPETRQDASLPPRVAAAQISNLLYQEGLIADPAVNARVNEYVAASRGGARARDSAVVEFRRWIGDWVAANPEKVAAARRAGGVYLPVADTTAEAAARKAQVDSVRQILRRGHTQGL